MAPFYGWKSTVSRLQSHYEEAVYFLELSSQKFGHYYSQDSMEIENVILMSLFIFHLLKNAFEMSNSHFSLKCMSLSDGYLMSFINL